MMLLTEGLSKGLRNEFKIFVTAINEAMVSKATKNICLTFLFLLVYKLPVPSGLNLA